MKFNWKIWATLILVSVLVMILRTVDFSSGGKYLIQRKWNNQQVGVMNHRFIESLNINTIYSDSIICTFDLTEKTADSNNTRVSLYDLLSYRKITEHDLSLPKTAQLKYATAQYLFYIDHFNLYRYDRAKRFTSKLNDSTLKCLNIVSGTEGKILVFGEQKKDSFILGFFTTDADSSGWHLEKTLEENPASSAAPKSLVYSGKFTWLGPGRVAYYCDKYARIYTFDRDFHFEREFATVDNAPKPELVSNTHAFFYKRGSTFNVNHGVRLQNGNLLVFSCRSKPTNNIIVDIYNWQTGNYIRSTEFHYKNWNCPDIISVTPSGHATIINFQEGVALFDFSSLAGLEKTVMASR